MKRCAAGFTLIELMVAVALLAIMAGIAVPSFAAFISNYRATAAANDMLQALTLTRGEALKRGRRVTLLPVSSDWTKGWIIFVDTDNDLALDNGETTIFKHEALPVNITAAAAGGASQPFGVNYVTFDGTGYPRTTTGGALSGGIVLTDSTGSATNVRTLCVSTYGRPRIVRAADACN